MKQLKEFLVIAGFILFIFALVFGIVYVRYNHPQLLPAQPVYIINQ